MVNIDEQERSKRRGERATAFIAEQEGSTSDPTEVENLLEPTIEEETWQAYEEGAELSRNRKIRLLMRADDKYKELAQQLLLPIFFPPATLAS